MRVAMVSGGGRGLGAAIVRRLLADGWALSLGLRDLSQAAQFGGEVFAHPFEATDPAAAAPWVAATAERFGRIDALVNNAGIYRFVDFDSGSEDDLDAMWAINVKGPFRLIREAMPHLRRAGAGRVVNIASTDAKRFRADSSIGYAMSKHALLALTQAAKFAGWADGVRATAICPGAIETDLVPKIPGTTPAGERLTPQTVAQIVALALSLPNQASLPEIVVNTRLEPLI